MDYEGNCLQEELFLHATSFYEYNPEDDELDDELCFRDPANPPTRGWNLKYGFPLTSLSFTLNSRSSL